MYRDAFEEIVRTSKTYSSSLKQIKVSIGIAIIHNVYVSKIFEIEWPQDVYNEHLVAAVSNQQEYEAANTTTELEAFSVEASHFTTTENTPTDVLKLKKELHSLEVKSRVLLQENNRLKDELIKEKERFAQRKKEEIAYLGVCYLDTYKYYNRILIYRLPQKSSSFSSQTQPRPRLCNSSRNPPTTGRQVSRQNIF